MSEMGFSQKQVEDAYNKVKELYTFPYGLRDMQLQAICHLVNCKHSFIVLPTGSGKTDIFVLVPLILDILDPTKKRCTLCIIPLLSLMLDMTEKYMERKVAITMVTKLANMSTDVQNGLKEGSFSVILTSPECIQDVEHWRQIFLESQVYKESLSLVAIDEVHVLVEW